MTVALKSNFFANARGVTLKDSASVTWALNANTNELSATAAGGSGLTSVGLSDSSGTPIYAVGNSPLVANGTLTLTLNTQAQKTFFAGPTSGANAQPAFRVLAVADVPTLNQNTTGTAAGLSVTLLATSGGTGQSAYAVGDLLYADTTTTLAKRADVAAGSYLRSGGVSTAPVWSTVTIPNAAVLGDLWYGSAASAVSALAGTISATKQFLTQTGNGSISAAPAWGTLAAGDLPANGANPGTNIGLAVVNGVATTWMRSDGAPALSQSIVPTWTGAHTFTPSSSVTAITVNANGANPSAAFIGAGTVPLTVQEMTAPSNNALSAFLGIATAAFTGGSGINGDLVLIPRTSNNCSLLFATGSSGLAAVRLKISGTGNIVANAAASGTTMVLGAGTATVTPLALTSGTVNTTPVAGGLEYDGTAFYASPAASDRGVMLSEYVEVMSGTKTLVSQTAAQAILNGTTNGAVTLPVGTYEFDCFFSLTALSATSGAFGFALGGTATFTQAWWAIADKPAALATAAAPQMTFDTAANTLIASAATGTVGYAQITGIIRVTVAGTVIPQVSQTTAAAAVVGANSFARFRVIGSATVQSVGNWS